MMGLTDDVLLISPILGFLLRTLSVLLPFFDICDDKMSRKMSYLVTSSKDHLSTLWSPSSF